MPLLILGMIRAIWALRREPQFVSLGLLTLIAIVSGTAFYSLAEGLRVVDAFYFSVVTLTTVGYGDFAPETDVGKLFTAVYVLLGIGILLSFVTTLAAKMSQTSPLHPFAGQPARGGGDFATGRELPGEEARRRREPTARVDTACDGCEDVPPSRERTEVGQVLNAFASAANDVHTYQRARA
jgi:voltage-gated potassium channel